MQNKEASPFPVAQQMAPLTHPIFLVEAIRHQVQHLVE